MSKIFPYCILIILFILNYLAVYPGGMTPDSFAQFQQSLSTHFESHHPPIMAMLWSIFHYIYPGPQTMLFFHLILIYASSLVLFISDATNKYRYIYILIPILPMIMSVSGFIWKDVGYGVSYIFVFAVCVYYLLNNHKNMPIYLFLILLLLIFYGTAVKFLAKFVLFPIVFLLVSVYLVKQTIINKIIIATILSLLIVITSSFVIRYYAKDDYGSQVPRLFDLVGIAVNIDSESVFPDYLINHPDYNFEEIKSTYHPSLCSFVYPRSENEQELKDLQVAFWYGIQKYPIPFIKHRIANFNWIMKRGSIHDAFGNIDDRFDIQSFHKFKSQNLQKLAKQYMSFYPKRLTVNYTSFSMLFLYILCMIILRHYSSPGLFVLKCSISICLLHLVALFFTAHASDYRFMFIFHLFIWFNLPILLKEFFNKISITFKIEKKHC